MLVVLEFVMHQSYTAIPGYAPVHVQTMAARLRKQVKDEIAARQEAEVCITSFTCLHTMLSAYARKVAAHDFVLLIVADRIGRTITPSLHFHPRICASQAKLKAVREPITKLESLTLSPATRLPQLEVVEFVGGLRSNGQSTLVDAHFYQQGVDPIDVKALLCTAGDNGTLRADRG
jgi:hypothetical protein